MMASDRSDLPAFVFSGLGDYLPRCKLFNRKAAR